MNPEVGSLLALDTWVSTPHLIQTLAQQQEKLMHARLRPAMFGSAIVFILIAAVFAIAQVSHEFMETGATLGATR